MDDVTVNFVKEDLMPNPLLLIDVEGTKKEDTGMDNVRSRHETSARWQIIF